MLSNLSTREDIGLEFERTREHIAILMERQGRTIQGLIDAIALMKYIDSEAR